MQFAPSICQQCSIGCNISPGERYGELRRIENRYNGTVNHYFLCDRGRFGYGYVNLKTVRVSRFSAAAMTLLLSTPSRRCRARRISAPVEESDRYRSPRASIESNLRCVSWWCGKLYTGIARGEQERLQLALKVLREGGITPRRCGKSNLMTRYWSWVRMSLRPARALRWRYARR